MATVNTHDKALTPFTIPLNGKWQPALDLLQLGEGDFGTLENFRYCGGGIRSVQGMTKVGTAANATYIKPRSGFYFRRNSPAESHALVQFLNAGETASVVLENASVVPLTGNMSGTIIHTDATGAGIGRFSHSPNQGMAYCNGVEACVWGGHEMRVGRYLDMAADGSYKYDYTDAISNSLTDALNVALMHRTADALDAATVVLLRGDAFAFVDSSTTPHGVTNAGAAVQDTVNKKFGAGALKFTGAATSYITLTGDIPDFDYTAGIFTIDVWRTAGTWANGETLYHHATDANNYFIITTTLSGSIPGIKIYSKNATVEEHNTTFTLPTTATSGVHHYALVENGNAYYLFMDGRLVGYLSSAFRLLAYSGNPTIGANNAGTARLNATFDEIRFSKGVARWVNDFDPPVLAYGQGMLTDVYIGSALPIKAIKWYVKTANTTAGTAQVYLWNSSTWQSVAGFTDGTAIAGVPLAAAAGSMTFTDTATTAKIKNVDTTFIYWYRVQFSSSSGIDLTTAISQVTLDTSMQQVKDIWDGIVRTIMFGREYTGAVGGTDFTLNVFNDNYLLSDASTYHQMNAFATSKELIVRFAERTTGVLVHMIPGYVNTSPSAVKVEYWAGSTALGSNGWVSVGTVDDGTSVGGASLGRSGFITWNAPDESLEFKSAESNEAILWSYRISFTNTLAAVDTRLYYVASIPAQKTIKDYTFPLLWQDRLLLCRNTSRNRNSIKVSSAGTFSVYNGTDSMDLFFGDEDDVVTGGSLVNRFGSVISETLIICKHSETWIVDGNSPQTYRQYQVSGSYGCTSPMTFKVCDTGFEIAPGINKHIVIWLSSSGPVMYDQNAIMPIVDDIKNYFEEWRAEYINVSMIDKFHAFYDSRNREYHLMIATGTSTILNVELVFDLYRRKWFKINRGTDRALQMGFEALDTRGNMFIYGGTDTGFLHRLENGYTFDGNALVSTVRFADRAFGSLANRSTIRNLRTLCKTKNTAAKLLLTHYEDTAAVASKPGTATMSINDTTHRLAWADTHRSIAFGPCVIHGIQLTHASTDVDVPIELVAMVGLAKIESVEAGGR